MESKILQAVGAITLAIVLLSGGWSMASATINLNSTNGVDTLKLLKILPSSGETVNVSTTFVINATSGDITKVGNIDMNGNDINNTNAIYGETGSGKQVNIVGRRTDASSTSLGFYTPNAAGTDTIRLAILGTADTPDIDITNANLDMNGNNITNVGNITTASGVSYARISSGNYVGSGTVNNAVSHGIGTIPKIVIITSDASGELFNIIEPGYVKRVVDSRLSVTNATSTNFYVGNSGDYQASANLAGRTYFWVAYS